MSTLDFTPETVQSLLDDSEQLSLALSMLVSHPNASNMKNAIIGLSQLLNQDLQEIQLLIRLQNQDSGGMGEAPMLSAS
ncbi:hypothetical protein ACROAE_20390 [Shewanella sp. MF05960]|jgi:hypothetical protein|uniref:hypothetical protein n=1 Tax=Shewanella sp. MF05960 TaxID=3434874 RepID=UPI003D7AB684